MRVICGAPSGLPAGFVGRVAHYRHRVFVEQLGWPLHAQDGFESDQFDRTDTVYVAVEDELGRIAGCARLLPTTQPYLLAEVFPQLLNGSPVPRDSGVWELSRFAAVDFNQPAATPLAQFSSSATALLMREAMICAASRGAARLITVSPMSIGGHAIFACWIELAGVLDA